MADDKKPQPYPSYILPGYSDTYEGPTFGDLLPKVESIEDLNDFSYMPSEFIDEQKKLAAEKRRQEVSKSRMMQSRLGDPELTPSQLIKIMQAKKLKDAKDAKDEKALTAKETYRMKSQVEGAKAAEDRRKKMIKENQEAAKEAEKFVPKDTVLGRIFDDRIREGEEISNRDKAFALLRNIGDNLSERRLVGGKEGTDTFSRIFGKYGGLREGMDEIEALEDEVIAREAADADRALRVRKENASYYKTIADTAKVYHDMNDQKFGDLEEEAIFAANTAMRAGDIDATGYDSFILEYMKNAKESRTGSTSALLNIYLDQLQRAAPEDQADILRKIQLIEQDLGIYEEKDETLSARDIEKE